MKKNSLIIALLFISVSFAHATVWRLNNAPGTDAHFTTLQTAHNSPLVLDGDTLYLEASSSSYGNLVATKKLVIIGAGYFLAENLNNQAIITSSVVSNITFNNGSQGSKIFGCQIQRIEINTSNVSIERNYITRNTNTNYLIIVNSDNINNLLIKNNYIQYNAAFNNHAYGIYTNKNGINNVTILNNYIYTPYFHPDKAAIDVGSGFSGLIQNNIVYGNIRINNSIFSNNILIDGVFTSSNTTVLQNISNGTQFGSDNGNQSNVNMDDVFIGTGSTDGQWQLKEGSPAIGAGLGGVDCGMFGGADPYILSGIPAIPAIYKFEIEVDNVEQKIDVEVSVKSRN